MMKRGPRTLRAERGNHMDGQTERGFWDDAEVISSYSRAQAIEDGELVDVSETAREAGIKFPVAITRATWGKYVEVPEGVHCQDEAGRLWDILWMFRCAAKRLDASRPQARADADGMRFSLHVRNDNREG